MADETRRETAQEPGFVELPAPTVWPIVFAFGVTLLLAGVLTSVWVSLVGVVLSLAGSIGWFREVLPQERHEMVPVEPEVVETRGVPVEVARMQIDPEIKRTRIPVEIYPYSAGLKGGLAGSVAMALLACLYGILSHQSIWYPINLLGSIVYAESTHLPMAYLTAFHPALLMVATLIHIVASVLVGLLYGVMLPMFPRRPIFLGGLIAPLMWSGLLYTSLGVINPRMDQLIDWKWFVASQIGFGIVAGLVVVRQERVRTRQFLPFAVRAGIEAPGIMKEKDGSGER
jgi:hypothetical protein